MTLLTGCGAGEVAPVHGRVEPVATTTAPSTPSSVFVASKTTLPVMSVNTQQASDSFVPAVGTVYQPPSSGDGTAAPFLVAMFASGEDCCSSFPGLRGPQVEWGFHRAVVQGRQGAVGRVGEGEIVVWTTPPTSQESDEAAVFGVGVSDAQLRRAADGTRANAHGANIVTAALPAGYHPVASGAVSVGVSALNGGFMVRYGNYSSYAQVETASGGDAFFALARATTAGHAAQIGGHQAWAGPAVVDGQSVQRYLWRDGEHVVAVEARGVKEEQLQQLVGSLRLEPLTRAVH